MSRRGAASALAGLLLWTLRPLAPGAPFGLSAVSVPAAVSALAAALALPADAATSDGIDASILAPGLLQANEAILRLERLTDEAESIGSALFRVHNEIGQQRALAKEDPTCETPWLLDLGARSRELGRGYRDAVQSARVQARRVEGMTIEPTVQPLLDPETNHKVTTLLERVDDFGRRYPEAASWHERYVEPLLRGCEPALVAAPGIDDPAPGVPAKDVIVTSPLAKKRLTLVAVIAFGGGFLCPGAVPAAGVMLVGGPICYSENDSCNCEPKAVSPATVLGPATSAGSVN
jgi:hypothetical protein